MPWLTLLPLLFSAVAALGVLAGVYKIVWLDRASAKERRTVDAAKLDNSRDTNLLAELAILQKNVDLARDESKSLRDENVILRKRVVALEENEASQKALIQGLQSQLWQMTGGKVPLP